MFAIAGALLIGLSLGLLGGLTMPVAVGTSLIIICRSSLVGSANPGNPLLQRSPDFQNCQRYPA